LIIAHIVVVILLLLLLSCRNQRHRAIIIKIIIFEHTLAAQGKDQETKRDLARYRGSVRYRPHVSVYYYLSLSLSLPTRRRPFQRTPIRGRRSPPTHRAGTRQNVCTRKTVDEQLPPPPPPPLFYNIIIMCRVFLPTHSLHSRVRRVTCVSVKTTRRRRRRRLRENRWYW